MNSTTCALHVFAILIISLVSCSSNSTSRVGGSSTWVEGRSPTWAEGSSTWAEGDGSSQADAPAVNPVANIRGTLNKVGDFTLTCKANCSEVDEQFRTDTAVMLKQVYKIKKCGKTFSTDYELNAFKDCISDLNLPDYYESLFEQMNRKSFGNKIDFKRAVRNASKEFCDDLNSKHAVVGISFSEILSEVTGGIEDPKDSKSLYSSYDDHKSYEGIHYHSGPSYFAFNFVIGLLILIILSNVIYFIVQWRRKKSEESIVNNSNEFGNNDNGEVAYFDAYGGQGISNNASFYDPMSPPSYNDVKV